MGFWPLPPSPGTTGGEPNPTTGGAYPLPSGPGVSVGIPAGAPGNNTTVPEPLTPPPATTGSMSLLANVSIFKQVGAIAIVWAVLAVGADSQDFGGLSAALAVTIAGTVLLTQGPKAITALQGMTTL